MSKKKRMGTVKRTVTMTALEVAAEAVGGKAALAKLLGVSKSCITMWGVRGFIPSDRILDMERVTGVNKSLLRPDQYPAGDS